MTDPGQPRVLIVDDERDALSLYTAFLSDDYDVVTTDSGKTALSIMDESVDLVLLDRRMPELSGDEVLAEIRRQYDCPVAMITAVLPELDTVELPFDGYLTKPVTREEVRELVESLLTRYRYGDAVREYFEIMSKIVLLDEYKTPAALEGSSEYAALLTRLEAIKGDAREALDDAIASGEFEPLFRSLDRE